MPQARPSKRPSDSGDGPADSTPAPKVKLARLERGPEEFSNVVKSKLQSYTRTGQACDRCKVRKIRCDALPEGCSHCATQNLECYVTDRVTGRTERRGYLQQLEREKGAMLVHIRELEKLLENNGVEVRPWQWPGYTTTYPPGVSFDHLGNPVQDPSSKDQWHQVGLVWVKNSQQKMPNNNNNNNSHGQTPWSLLSSRPKESYLGVSSDSAPLSSIKGTTLSILGTNIDITCFDAPDMDEPPPGTPIGSPLYNKSAMAFLQSALNINPPLTNVELPAKMEAFRYAEWYFLMIQPFLPILHKPSFMQLLTRIYDDPTCKPTVPELVIVHMVLATIYFQYGVRNREEPEKHAQLNDLSNKHYHWSLSKFFDLVSSQSVTAVQALAMIASHTRNFPKPECSLAVSSWAFGKAVEMNLHRAVKIAGGGTTLDNELRKRVWWAILAILCTLNGRLGRPMPISVEEFDVEFPVAIDDQYIGEEGILDPSKIGHCNYHAGLMGFKITPLFIEMYSKIYSVRRDPSKYVQVVTQLEEALRNLLEGLPDELRVEKCQPGNRMFALYTQAFCLEFTLCLRHPSVCLTDDPKICAENTRICEDAARKLLKVVGSLYKLKSLDTTWYQQAVYVAAIFSALVAHWQRRYETTALEVATLREDMSLWLCILGEIGRLSGTGSRLATEVGGIIERTINWIEQDMGRKPESSAGQLPSKQQQPSYPTPAKPKQHIENPLVSGGVNTVASEHRSAGATNGNAYYDAGVAAPTAAYPSLNYGDQTNGGAALNHNGNGTVDSTDGAQYLYAAASAATAAAAPNPTAAMEQAAAAQNPLIAFASQATQHVAGQATDNWQTQTSLMAHPAAPGNPWQDWTNAIQDTQDRYSANALLTLNAGRPGDVGTGTVVDHVGQGDAMPNPHAAGQWPLLLFHDGSGNVSGP
ncbi:fungal-specific transcription factor domain-containing protein [Corynascus novoguineensis]|uniref:Fungal-specific transcription factor domain-containing protein n=1 Tax=Corynascus novoguineensis TaxID=1126955 RepID=A0AAN7HS22_9PEZI|nr:fungal-specific transcription factor domain-containing protein [Corynascus novoguineensis]